MNKTIITIFIFTSILYGCKKEEDIGKNTRHVFTNGMSFSANGAHYIFDSVEIIRNAAASPYEFITIRPRSSVPAIIIHLPLISKGSYDLSNREAEFIQNGKVNFSTYGTLTITDSGDYVKGNFNFAYNDFTKIVEGVFNIPN